MKHLNNTIFLLLLLAAAGYSQTWLPPSTVGTTLTLNGVFFADEQYGWAVGNSGSIYKSNDGGFNWQPQTSGVSTALNACQFVTAGKGWAVGDAGTILYTSNGGASWSSQTSGSTLKMQSVFMITPLTGWIVGQSGSVLFTNTGGNTWSTVNVSVTATLNTVYFKDFYNGYIGGTGGLLLKTTDGGNTWFSVNSGTTEDINCINGEVAVCNHGVILQNNVAAGSWTIATSPTTVNLLSVYSSNNTNQCWAVGLNGTLLQRNSVNGWKLLTSPTSYHLNSIYFTTELSGWIVGGNGVVVKFQNDVGLTENDKSISVSAFPNPLAAEVKIKLESFSGAETGYTITNNLGQAVLTGVANETVTTIDTQSLPTGIYFLSLTAYPKSAIKLIKN